MNIFQRQLLLEGKTLAELAKAQGWTGFEIASPPTPVSIEEFEMNTWDEDETEDTYGDDDSQTDEDVSSDGDYETEDERGYDDDERD